MSYRDDFRGVEKETYWTLSRIFFVLVVTMIMFYTIGFLATGGDLAIYKFWAPKQADAENQVFHHTQAYTDGKSVDISKLKREYETATDSNLKNAWKNEILDEASTVDINHLPQDEQAFIINLRNGN